MNWSVSGTGTGSISSGGLYTAPATVPTNNVVTITATSQVQSTLTATQSLTLEQPTAIAAVTCVDSGGASASTVASKGQLACTATASTGSTVPVNWTVTNKGNLGGDVGSISAQGIYTAPAVPPPGQMVTITATSQATSSQTMSVNATVIFGNAVIGGQYVFSTTGRLTSQSFWARAGSFNAGGGVLSGIEDLNQGGTTNLVSTQISYTGSYSVGADGRGTMQFCEGTAVSCPLGSASATAFFHLVVVSPTLVQIIETPTAANLTAGGEMVAQSLAGVSGNAILSGVYSFNFSGVSSAGTEESAVGEFAANGGGTIAAGSAVAPLAPGAFEINAGGPVPQALQPYTITSNGRGTVKLGGLSFSFYPVSASRAKFIEIDPVPPATGNSSILLGDAYRQQTSVNCGWGLSALSGSTVFETSGQASNIAVADVGSFTASSGSITAASIDENSGGTVSSALGTLTGAYTMDPCGRGTLTIGTHSYVFYMIASSDAVLQETSTGIIGHGFLLPAQGGPLADATLTGSYAFRLGGTDAAGSAGHREDLLGQFASAGTGTGIAGTLDLNDFGVTQANLAIANGTFLPLPSGTLRGTLALPVATSPATTRNLVLYMVSPTLFYALEVDAAPAGMGAGVVNNQF